MTRKTGLILLGIFIIILGGILIYLIFKSFGGDVGNIFGLQKGSENAGIGDGEGEGSGVSSGGELSDGAGEAGEGKKSFGGGGGAGGGGAGGGSDGSTIPESANCYELQVPYALKNFEESSACNNFQEGICTDRSFSCSLEVHNLDEEVSGTFVLRFVIFEKETYNQLDSTLKESFLEPGKFEKIEAAFNLQSEGADGAANKKGDCRFFTESAPRKEFCE